MACQVVTIAIAGMAVAGSSSQSGLVPPKNSHTPAIGPEEVLNIHRQTTPTAIWERTYGKNSAARYTATPRRGVNVTSAASRENTNRVLVPTRMNRTVFHNTAGIRSSVRR